MAARRARRRSVFTPARVSSARQRAIRRHRPDPVADAVSVLFWKAVSARATSACSSRVPRYLMTRRRDARAHRHNARVSLQCRRRGRALRTRSTGADLRRRAAAIRPVRDGHRTHCLEALWTRASIDDVSDCVAVCIDGARPPRHPGKVSLPVGAVSSFTTRPCTGHPTGGRSGRPSSVTIESPRPPQLWRTAVRSSGSCHPPPRCGATPR